MNKNKKIALVAHDNRKKDLVEWIQFNADKLMHHTLICTGTTGKLVEATLIKKLNLKEISIIKL